MAEKLAEVRLRYPVDLHNEIKEMAVEDGRTLQKQLVALVKEAVAARKAAPF